MPRDYKHRVTRRRKRRPASPWLGMAAGLLIGLFAAAIAYFKLIAPPQQVTAPAFVPETPEPEEETVPSPSPARPRFDFYTILPEMEVVIPEEELTAKTPSSTFRPVEQPAAAAHERAPAASTPAKPAAASVSPQSQPPPAVKPASSSGGNYFLQSGTFKTMDQAERLKAQLALLGLGASVQKVTINKNTIHRVRVGPFRDYTALNAARAKMRQHGIQSTPVMIRK